MAADDHLHLISVHDLATVRRFTHVLEHVQTAFEAEDLTAAEARDRQSSVSVDCVEQLGAHSAPIRPGHVHLGENGGELLADPVVAASHA